MTPREVARILRRASEAGAFDGLGQASAALDRAKEIVDVPEGHVLVVGWAYRRGIRHFAFLCRREVKP